MGELRAKINIGPAIIATVCIAAIIAAAVFLPGARLSFMLPATALGAALALWIYSNCTFRTEFGYAVLMVGYTLVVCGIFWNINYYTSGGELGYGNPLLLNNDHGTDWWGAVNRLYGDRIPEDDFWYIGPNRYYGYLIQALLFVFGRDIGVPLMFNAFCYPLAIILIGAISWKTTKSRTTASVTMLVATLMCYFMEQATVLIKDVPLTMCVAAVAFVMVRWLSRPVNCGDIVLVCFALIGISFLRANFLLMIVLGTLIFFVRRRNFDYKYLWLAAGCLLMFFIIHWLFWAPNVADNVGVAYGSGVFDHHANVRAWDTVLEDDYEAMPVWRRVLWLPASVAVQFLIPFPWNFTRDMIYGPTQAVAHFGYFWYYAGAVLIYWIFATRRKSPLSIGRLVIWGVLLTVLTAYMTSGRVSRYCLLYLPMLLPAVGYTLVNFYRQKSFWIWIATFSAMLVPVLLICHKMQMSAL